MNERATTGAFDGEAVCRALDAVWRDGRDRDGGEPRTRALKILGEAFAGGRAAIEARFEKDRDGAACAARLSNLQDELMGALYDCTVTHVCVPDNPSDAERVGVVAQGGYGRGSLAPGSDVDLLFLLPRDRTAWGERVAEHILYMLWDLGFKVGHAARSVEECIRLSASDHTVLTAMLEVRHIRGDKALFDDLVVRYRRELAQVRGAAEAFIAAKLKERDERHLRAGRYRYLVEPDVKNGKGGMRDLHTLFWIAKFVLGAEEKPDFVKAGIFTGEERKQFRACEDFLWTVRCHLHFLTGRDDDKLTFDKQADMAARMGYRTGDDARRVERFMRDYFLIAKQVGDLTRIFCSVLEERQLKPAPATSDSPRRAPRSGPVKESADFVMDTGRIGVSRENAFDADPVNLIMLYWLADKYDCSLRPDTLKLATRSLKLITRAVRNDPRANALFLDVLTSKKDPETVLRRMNESGVLGRFIPDFGKIIAHMQFNMYHHYTVDEHLLRAVGVLSEIERGELAEDHPLSHRIIHTLKNRRTLFVAVFLHDVAKGRDEDHSIEGSRIARKLCPRFGMDAAETETVAWLVRHHLLMSETAQMRDLNDFRTVSDFAAAVQSMERLKLLMILTVADIKAVGPGVWNGWKGQLLRTLYFETEAHLSGGHIHASRADRVRSAHEEFREAMTDWPADKIEVHIGKHHDPYWLTAGIERQIRHALLIDRADRPVTTEVGTDGFTAITELTVHAPDHPRLLALMAGACAAAGANIAGARIHTTADGHALDTLLIRRELPDGADELRRAERVAELVSKALTGEARLEDFVNPRAKPTGRTAAFSVEPQATVDNEASDVFTMIEVSGLDRAGLLFDLTEALFRLDLNIGSAHVTTFGEKVVDVFYVTDLAGRKIVDARRRAAVRRGLLAALAPDGGKRKAN